jgi:hypothetical protein
LATTDFIASSGTNRAFSIARQIFVMGKEPEEVFNEMVKATFPSNGRDHYDRIIDNAQIWLRKANSRKRLRPHI